jgi:hypothetical protein
MVMGFGNLLEFVFLDFLMTPNVRDLSAGFLSHHVPRF